MSNNVTGISIFFLKHRKHTHYSVSKNTGHLKNCDRKTTVKVISELCFALMRRQKYKNKNIRVIVPIVQYLPSGQIPLLPSLTGVEELAPFPQKYPAAQSP